MRYGDDEGTCRRSCIGTYRKGLNSYLMVPCSYVAAMIPQNAPQNDFVFVHKKLINRVAVSSAHAVV